MVPASSITDRKRAGWSVGQAAWRLGMSVREYREIEAADRREYEARRTVQLLEYQMAAAAVVVPPPRRTWWRRLRKRRR